MLHATLLALHGGSGWRGVLLTGPSGAGKSDLALRCLDAGWRLVADDRVIVWQADGRLFGRAPASLAGVLELRGQGMVRVPPLAVVEIAASVSLMGPKERQPGAATEMLCGVSLPCSAILPLEASAPARLRRIVEGLDHGL